MRKKAVPLNVINQKFESLSVEMFRRFKLLISTGADTANKVCATGVIQAL